MIFPTLNKLCMLFTVQFRSTPPPFEDAFAIRGTRLRTMIWCLHYVFAARAVRDSFQLHTVVSILSDFYDTVEWAE